MLKVSVITVSFNAEKTIARTLVSVNEQTYPQIEHIVIDGCSTDRTMEIVAALKHRPGNVVSEADRGIYDAMNKGLKQATGDVICFLNADDRYVTETIVAEVVSQIEESQANIVYGDVVYVSPEGQTTRYYDSQRFNKSQLKYGWMPAHPSLFAVASVYRKLGEFDATFKVAGDFEMCCRMFQVPDQKSVYLAKPFVEMLVGGASAVSLANVIRVNREILIACRMNGIATNYLNLMSRYGRKLKELAIRVR